MGCIPLINKERVVSAETATAPSSIRSTIAERTPCSNIAETADSGRYLNQVCTYSVVHHPVEHTTTISLVSYWQEKCTQRHSRYALIGDHQTRFGPRLSSECFGRLSVFVVHFKKKYILHWPNRPKSLRRIPLDDRGQSLTLYVVMVLYNNGLKHVAWKSPGGHLVPPRCVSLKKKEHL